MKALYLTDDQVRKLFNGKFEIGKRGIRVDCGKASPEVCKYTFRGDIAICWEIKEDREESYE